MGHSSRGSLSLHRHLLRWIYLAVVCCALVYSNAQSTDAVASDTSSTNAIVITRNPRDNPIASVLKQLGIADYMVDFSVDPSDCSISPDPSKGIPLAGYDSRDVTPNYFTVTCPDAISEASINFSANRDDQKVVVSGNVATSAERNLTSVTVTKSQTTSEHPYVQLTDLHLCNNMTESAVCKDFEVNVVFSRIFPPVLSKIQVVNGPATLQQPYFTSDCEVYPVQLYQNVPAVFALQSNQNNRIHVDSSPVVPNSSKGFISSSQFVNYRPRVEPGMIENVTVYAATYDQSQSRNYTIMIQTVESSEPRLATLGIAPGRLEPQFSPHVYSYFARVPEGRQKYTLSLTGLDDVHTRCMVNQDNSTIITGSGDATIYMPADSQPGSHTVIIDCTPQDKSDSVRYTLALVPQKGGSTLLNDLDIVGGQFDRSFDPLNHGPYLANLELQRLYDQGWIAFIGHPSNSRASMTADYIPFNNTNGMSPWFRVEKGEFRRFRIAVRTPENPVEEEYFVHVDRRGKWYEASTYARKLADWIGWTSVMSSTGSAPAFLQNMHLMQFISVSNRMNGKPETYDAWSEGFNKWNLQWRAPFVSKPESETEITNGTLNDYTVVVPPEPYNYIINAAENPQVKDVTTTTTTTTTSEVLTTEASTILSSLTTEFYTSSSSGQWIPAIDLTTATMADVAADVVEAAVVDAFTSSENAAVARRRLSALTDEDKFNLIQEINATYKQHSAVRDYMSTIVLVTLVLIIVAAIYATAAAIAVNRAIKSKDGRVRDMPKILHPIRFWSFVFDIVLIAYAQSGFGIISCPASLKNTKFIILGFIHVTPKVMVWFAGFILVLFPVAYLCLVGWVLFSLKKSVVFSKDLNRYHKKDLFVAKAESKILPWLPSISSLLAVEIRDAFPIFRPGDEDIDDDIRERPPIEFVEENRKNAPCSVDAPEFGLSENQQDPIASRNKTNDQHYAMLPHGQHEERIRYHPASDELKVSLGGLRTSHSSDSDNAPIYNKYPDAEVGRKCFKVKNPYGLELDCHALLQMKHLSNLWQMSELPHHFHFWIPRQNCQMLDLDGWNHFFDKSHRGNFMYYLIDRIALLSIVGVIVCWAERSGFVTGLTIACISLALAALYTPAAIATGTSKWFAQMEEELRLREKEARFEEAEKDRQNRWPFTDEEVKQRVNELQQQREALDACGHGGWYARHRDCGISQWSFWHHRSFFCLREWVTGAPGFELTKCLIIAVITLGNSKAGLLSNGPASTLAFIFACFGSICLNYESLLALLRQFKIFNGSFKRFMRRTAIWLHDTFTDSGHIGGRFSHLFSTLGLRLRGIRNAASFDYPRTLGERVRDYQVRDCSLIADEVGLQFCGPVKPSDMTSRLQQRVGSRHTERYGLMKTLYTTGPIGAYRRNIDDSFPVRLPFRDFYLGKLTRTQGVAATVHVVNHGFRCELTDPKEKDVFTSEDDSYLSLYRDPRFLPEWGMIRTKHSGHGYVIHYDYETHSLMVKGPSLREGVEYRVKTDQSFTSKADDGLVHDEDDDDNYSLSTESLQSEGGRCVGQAVCTTSGTLYVPVPQGKPPSLYDSIEVQSPEGDRFTINPNDIKVHYDQISRELVLRHRLFIELDEQSVYRVAWTIVGLGVPVNESATCHETGILHVKLSKPGIPDLRSLLSFKDSNDVEFTADPKDTDAHRVALPTTKEPRGFGLVLSRIAAKVIAVKRQISGKDALRESVESTIPCTVVQCVNPSLGQYRIEPNFRETMKNVRAQIHSLEAQRSQLDDVDRLATAWHSVMSHAEFCRFWETHGVNVVPTEALWINPLRDLHDPLVKSQFSKIESAVPEFRSIVQRLFAARVKELESDLHTLSQWVRAYDDVDLYGAQLQKDLAEMSGYTSQTGLESYVRKVRSFKQQYESQVPNFSYPFVVEERHITRMPNIAAQLRQWQRQLAVWLRAEEDAPLLNVGLGGTPRSISSSGSERASESASLERTVMEVMHALKDNIDRLEDPSIGRYRSVLHYVTDSLNVRGPYTNWRPDPIGGHVALVRVWFPKPDGTPDFEREPVWNPCCVKLSANAIKILLPGKDDVDFRFATPYYWSHVLGHSIQLDCLETLEVTHQKNLPVGHASNLMLKAMPGQLVCRLTSVPQLRHVGDQHIRLVENGAPGQEILMRRDGVNGEEEDIGSTPRSSEGEAFLISLGKRMNPHEARNLPTDEVRVSNDEAQVFPLTFRFGERFVAKWAAVVKGAQMDKPPLEIDDQFGLPLTESNEALTEATPPSESASELTDSESSHKLTIPSEVSSSSHHLPTPPPTPHEEQAVYEGDWQNYRYHGKGRLMDGQGNEVYNGDWIDGKRWGKGRYTFRDARGVLWQYEGEFKNDELCGKGRLSLIDENELKKLKSSTNPSGHTQMVDFIGEVRGTSRRTKRGYTAPLQADKPNLPPAVLKQLFDKDPSYNQQDKPLIIDVRRTMSCAGDIDTMKDTLGDLLNGTQGSLGSSLDSQASYEAAKDEYLPHRTRWARSLDPSLGFESLQGRLVVGTVHFADGAVYQGRFHNGVPHGKGRYMSADESVRCDGNWSKGVPHGFAVLTEKKGDGTESSYFGSFVNGKRSGHGIQTSKDGLVYVEGQWTDDAIKNSQETLINIQPEAVQTPGSIVRYTGSVVNGLPEGEGKLTWTDRVTYRGNLSKGVRHGHGVMRDDANRVLVSASWKDDVPHGRVARLVQPDGKVYTGDVYEGKRQGMGELYHSEKGEPFFEGLWVNNMAHGRGTLYAKDGTYEGEFKAGKREGKGTFDYSEHPAANGKTRLYVGDWKNDVPDGVGKYRNDLGVENTYKFHKGQLEKSSLNAYKNGMCGKVPLIGVAPTVSPAVISNTSSTHYGKERPVTPNIFEQLMGDQVRQPLWSRLVADKPMQYVDPTKAPQQALRPAAQPPSRPISEDGSKTPGDFQTESPIRKRLLKVTVVSGKDLPVLDGNTKPYVKVIIGKEMKKTKVVEKASFAPSWNSSLNFPLRREQRALLEVWDQDLQSRDRFMATGEIDLMKFLSTNKRESDLMIVSMLRPNPATGRDEAAGTVSLRLAITELTQLVGESSSEGASVEQTNNSNKATPVPPPYVYVRVKQGRNLTNMDVMKNMDPYVKVILGSQTQQTKVQKKAGVNPKFEEEFYLPFDGQQRLTLEVFDKDTLSSDDFVGRAEINLPIFSFSGSVKLYRADKKKGSVEAGVLDVSVNTIQS